MERSDKDAVRAKLARSIGKEPTYEEKKRRKERAKQRRSLGRKREAPTLDDDEEPRPGRPRRTAHGNDATRDGCVVGIVRASVRVRVDGVEVDVAPPRELALAIGDRVRLAERSGRMRIVELEPRRTRLARPDPADPRRELVLAANVDVGVIVASVVAPPLVAGLVDRLRLALERGGVRALVAVNKVELLREGGAEAEELDALVAEWRALDLDVHRVSASTGVGLEGLRASLDGRTSVLVGHSGVGKSSLANALAPHAELTVGELAVGANRGRHTTTAGRMLELGADTWLIDTPGVRQFGLAGWTAADVRAAFADLASFASDCRFRDCTHLVEPECAVRAAVERGALGARRFESYARIARSLASD
ncbi:MAG: ribosome small subunit-dependent GTPase A [Planctomycetes bacterium]|nr:ribosome small subunit-dependent GTPase A [Planctomycetota bacterium]